MLGRYMTRNVVPYDPVAHTAHALRDQFSSMVTVDSYQQSLEERRILSGENPFKVWREHFCARKEDVADFMDVDIVYYTQIEAGEDDPNADDILSFCRYFGLHPFDLMDDRPASAAMIEALLCVHDNPDLLSPRCQSSNDKAAHILIEESRQGYNDFFRMREKFAATYPVQQSLTIAFLDKAMALDGRLDLRSLDLFDQAYMFWQMEEDCLDYSRVKSKSYYQDHLAHHKVFNNFGNMLHRGDWVRVCKKLESTIKKTSLDEALEIYRTDPSFIGRKSFPELPYPMLIGGKAYTWDQAHKTHIILTELRHLAYEEYLRHHAFIKKTEQPLELFDEWISSQYEIIARFENRQKILQHPDFRHLADDVPRGPSLPAPHIADKWVRMFGL